MKSYVICFFGSDGSGKSTLARYVTSYFRSKGFSVYVAWLRGTHTIASMLARFLSKFSTFRGGCNPYYGICIPKSMKLLWLWIEFVSVLPIVLTRFVVPKLFGRVVAAERSLIDFLVWLVLTLRWCGAVRSFVTRAVLSLNNSLCDRVIYVRADEDVLLSRRRGSAEESLIPLELRIYDAIAKWLGTPCIDTSRRSIDECVAKILELVGADHG